MKIESPPNRPITRTPDEARPISPSQAAQVSPLRKPDWLKIRPPAGENYLEI